MSLSDRSDAGRDPLALDGLLTDDERRPLSVQGHHQFRESYAMPSRTFDDIDLDAEIDEHIEIDPHVSGTNNRRTDKELDRLLNIIDRLPISTNGKGGLH